MYTVTQLVGDTKRKLIKISLFAVQDVSSGPSPSLPPLSVSLISSSLQKDPFPETLLHQSSFAGRIFPQEALQSSYPGHDLANLLKALS